MILGLIESIISFIGVICIFLNQPIAVGVCALICLFIAVYEFDKGHLNSLLTEFVFAAIGAVVACFKSIPLWRGIACALCIESFLVTIISLPAFIKQWKYAHNLAKLDYVHQKFTGTIIENQNKFEEKSETERIQKNNVKVKVKPIKKNK